MTGVAKQQIYINVLSVLFSIIGPKNYHYNAQSGMLQLFGQPWIVMGAKDEGSEKYIKGATVGFAFADEVTEMPETYFKMLLTRLSPPGARFYGTTNPREPLHWFKREYLDNVMLHETGRVWDMHVTMDDNPNLTEEYKATQKSLYSGVFYQRFIDGLWVMGEGSIYRDSWSDSLLYDDSTRPDSLYNAGGYQDKWVAVDCGVDHPQVYLMFYDDGDSLWVDKEYFWDSKTEMKQKTDSEYAKDLEKFMGGGNNTCEVILPPECASFEAELVGRGIWVTDADNEVTEGIKTVASLMSARKLRIHKSCVNLIKQLQNYRWDPSAAKRGVEQPLKQFDDSCDAARYGCKTKVPIWRLIALGLEKKAA